MTDFPIMVYRSPGKSPARYGTYDYCGVESQDELDEALSLGWSLSVEEAVDTYNKAVEAAVRLKNEPKVKIVVSEPESEAAPAPEAAGEPVLLAEDEEEEDKPRRRRK
jgi:hypothetical protein